MLWYYTASEVEDGDGKAGRMGVDGCAMLSERPGSIHFRQLVKSRSRSLGVRHGTPTPETVSFRKNAIRRRILLFVAKLCLGGVFAAKCRIVCLHGMSVMQIDTLHLCFPPTIACLLMPGNGITVHVVVSDISEEMSALPTAISPASGLSSVDANLRLLSKQRSVQS